MGEEPDAGTISFDERSINDLAPQQRGFGLMFQDLALFPHMDVFGNVAFGLRMQKLPTAQVQARVHETENHHDARGDFPFPGPAGRLQPGHGAWHELSPDGRGGRWVYSHRALPL